ncbi:MAG TPA: hypothetical protein VGK89_11475 [Candidatus Eisenbacteria bacterium]|jgi:hypothetical protein
MGRKAGGGRRKRGAVDGLNREGLPVPKPTSEGEFVEVEAA